MKKYLFSLLIFIILPLSSIFAQDISAIGQWVKSSPDEYNSLLGRFEQGEELTDSDLEKLYYGFAFRKEYNGNLDLFAEMYAAQKTGDRERALEEAMKCKAQNPVCLELLYPIAMLTYKTAEGAGNVNRLTSMIKAVMSSGDGKSPQSAIKVIRTGDEYKILSMIYHMEELKMQTALVGNIDQMDIRTREGKELTVYFDRSLPSARDAEILSSFLN